MAQKKLRKKIESQRKETEVFVENLGVENSQVNTLVTDKLAGEILAIIFPKGKFNLLSILTKIHVLSAKIFLWIQMAKPNVLEKMKLPKFE